jgi:acyl-CoA thioester hydrolase
MTVRAAPHRSRIMTIDPQWIDYNGHLNMAYYNVLFDLAIDEFLIETGLGPDYIRAAGCSYMCVEVHICYVREIFLADPVVVDFRVLDVDGKRLHTYAEMRHAHENWLSATSEAMFLHTDMTARKVVPWPTDLATKLGELKTASDALPRPARAGRGIAIKRRGDA